MAKKAVTATHLRPVQITLDGELAENAPQTLADALNEITELTDQLAGAEKEVRAWRARYANLKREVEGEVDRDHQQFPEIIALFRYWQERCDHPKAEFTADRFKAALPFLKRHGPRACREAIRGAEYDPYIVTRKNGREHRHDAWGQIFASEDRFQSYRQRAPDFTAPTFSQLSLIEAAKDVAERVLERAKLIDRGTDPVALAHLLLEVDRAIYRWREAPLRTDAQT